MHIQHTLDTFLLVLIFQFFLFYQSRNVFYLPPSPKHREHQLSVSNLSDGSWTHVIFRYFEIESREAGRDETF